MITEDYCSIEVARLLKEKGFPFTYLGQYYIKKIFTEGDLVEDTFSHAIAMKWLREKKDLFIDISFIKHYKGYERLSSIWNFDIFTINKDDEPVYDDNEFLTYEEAVDAALKYSLENLIHDEEENQTSKDDQC